MNATDLRLVSTIDVPATGLAQSVALLRTVLATAEQTFNAEGYMVVVLSSRAVSEGYVFARPRLPTDPPADPSALLGHWVTRDVDMLEFAPVTPGTRLRMGYSPEENIVFVQEHNFSPLPPGRKVIQG